MAFDFKKEYKEFYMPKNKPEIVTVPVANYIAVRGKGNPNQEGGTYQQAVGILYAIAYTIKMSYKGSHNVLKLSGGQQQRVAIARALASMPRLSWRMSPPKIWTKIRRQKLPAF